MKINNVDTEINWYIRHDGLEYNRSMTKEGTMEKSGDPVIQWYYKSQPDEISAGVVTGYWLPCEKDVSDKMEKLFLNN